MGVVDLVLHLHQEEEEVLLVGAATNMRDQMIEISGECTHDGRAPSVIGDQPMDVRVVDILPDSLPELPWVDRCLIQVGNHPAVPLVVDEVVDEVMPALQNPVHVLDGVLITDASVTDGVHPEISP